MPGRQTTPLHEVRGNAQFIKTGREEQTLRIGGVWAYFCTMLGLAGGLISTAFGGWTNGMTFLIICMITDYLTGVVVAYVFHKSPKTTSGGASSKIGFQGLAKKGGILLVVFIAYRLESISGTAFIRDGAVIAYIVNELTSVIENLGLMGVPLPKIITRAFDILKDKEEAGQ